MRDCGSLDSGSNPDSGPSYIPKRECPSRSKELGLGPSGVGLHGFEWIKNPEKPISRTKFTIKDMDKVTTTFFCVFVIFRTKNGENKNKIVTNFNQFFQFLPQFGHFINDYAHVIKKMLNLLKQYLKNNEHFKELKADFLRTIKRIRPYWLTEEDKQKFNEINKKIKYIPLTAIEFSK